MEEDVKEEVSDLTEESSTEETTEQEKTIPYNRFKEVLEEKKELEEKLAQKAELKPEIPDDEQKIREIIDRREKEKVSETKKQQESINRKLDELEEIHGPLDRKNFLEIVDKYGVKDETGGTDWGKAVELYERFEGEPKFESKKKAPSSSMTTDESKVETSVDISKKSLHDLVQEGLKKFGVKD